MGAMILWWASVEGLGVVCLPLAATALAHLPDRGWLLAKPLGLLLWCYLVWLPLVIAPALPYSRGFLFGALAAFLLVNIALLPRTVRPLGQLVRRHWGYLLIGEGVFAGAGALLAWVRAFTPDIAGTEKFMDMAFVTAIWRASHLPPPDPWLSGYPINYYYFGHFIIATLAKLLGTAPAIAFNTGISIIFALTAVAVYSVTGNAVAAGHAARVQALHMEERRLTASRAANLQPAPSGGAGSRLQPNPVAPVSSRPGGGEPVPMPRGAGFQPARGRKLFPLAAQVGLPFSGGTEDVPASSAQVDSALCTDVAAPDYHLLRVAPLGIFAVVLVLLLGNLAGAQEWLAYRTNWAAYNWWNPSRVIPNTINEFPAFSFLLADLHAHVLALPFAVLGIGFALHVLLGRGTGLRSFGAGLVAPLAGLVAAIALGALYAINGWDIPTYLGIVGICLALQQWVAHGRRWSAVLARDVGAMGVALVLLCVVCYLPFYLTFNSPAQGIGLVTAAERTPLPDLGLIFGTQALLAWGLLALLAVRAAPALAVRLRQLWAGSGRTRSGRLTQALWAITLVVVVAEVCFLLVVRANAATFLIAGGTTLVCALLLGTARRTGPDALFAVILIGVAGALVALCEVVYLRDVFAGSLPRMNTVFKFYFQAWILLGIGGACALGVVRAPGTDMVPRAPILRGGSAIEAERHPSGSTGLSPDGSPASGRPLGSRASVRVARTVWIAALLVLLLGGAVYPIMGTYARTGGLAQPQGLDGASYLRVQDPGDYAAIRWLNQHVRGEAVIVEASGPEYSAFARVSTFTGLPTVMGWDGHELQWRINWLHNPAHNADFARRLADLDAIYTSANRQQVLSLLHRYHAKYLYVGPLEQEKYPDAPLSRFRQFLPVVYSSAGVTIYAVPS
jgi:YYY domain-containing protein